ncbi:MAG: hypothetical protein XXXJIFNMEKO3_01319 [Candidatus Erwinia impunctatus]|nr:hypothetical protein XXXJIFNMEKO_01319 [Culicoides impunctatus]
MHKLASVLIMLCFSAFMADCAIANTIKLGYRAKQP